LNITQLSEPGLFHQVTSTALAPSGICSLASVMTPLQLYSILAVGFLFTFKGEVYVFQYTIKKRE